MPFSNQRNPSHSWRRATNFKWNNVLLPSSSHHHDALNVCNIPPLHYIPSSSQWNMVGRIDACGCDCKNTRLTTMIKMVLCDPYPSSILTPQHTLQREKNGMQSPFLLGPWNYWYLTNKITGYMRTLDFFHLHFRLYMKWPSLLLPKHDLVPQFTSNPLYCFGHLSHWFSIDTLN